MGRGSRAWLELAGFWAVAIAYPVLDSAVSGPEALTQLYADWIDVAVLIGVTMLLGPTLLLLVEVGVGRLSSTVRAWFHVAILSALVGLVVWQAALDAGLAGALRALAPLLSIALVATALRRYEFARQFAFVLGALATPAVALVFLATAPVTATVIPAGGGPEDVAAGSGTPVVLLIVDELPLAALVDETGRMDSTLFPNFAGLAADSNWYRNARTVGSSTVTAVPAMLTGQAPDDYSQPPALSKYPENLYTYLHAAGYDISADEAITQLCPHSVCAPPASRPTRLSYLLVNGAGSQPAPAQLGSRIASRLRDTVADPPRTEAGRFEDFIGRVTDERSRLTMLHSSLPHVPWELLPSGQGYAAPYVLYDLPRDRSEADQAIQRMMLQTAYVDAMLGRAIARMKAIGLWRRSLFIVVADHGGSFDPDIPRRAATPETAGWVLPVPLLVKYPGQLEGSVIDRTVTTDQVLPTILEETGVGVPTDVPVEPLDSPDPSPGGIRVMATGIGWTDFSERMVRRRYEAATEYRHRLFGDGSFYAVGGRAELLGKPVAALESMRPVAIDLDDPDALQDVDPTAATVPAYIGGSVEGAPQRESFLAFALNGRVVATGHTWGTEELRFATMVPVAAMRPGANRFEVLALRKR